MSLAVVFLDTLKAAEEACVAAVNFGAWIFTRMKEVSRGVLVLMV